MERKHFQGLLGCVILIMLVEPVVYSAANTTLMFWKGDLNLQIDKSVYSSGEVLNARIHISNGENYSITDGKLVIEIVKGCNEPAYPAQLSDCDNVIYEEVLEHITLLPLSSREISWNFTIPSYFSAGDYRLDAFFIANRAPLKGIHFIFLPGEWTRFKVSSSGNYPLLKILRTKTEFGRELGQVAAPVNSGAMFNGSVWIQAESAEAIGKKFILKIGICSWDDTECEDYAKILPFTMDSQLKVLNVMLQAPSKPDAYAIRIEVVDENGVLHSLYRSRIIVTGVTAKIRKVGILYPFLKHDEVNEVYVLVGTSPDHYTNPVVQNVECSVKITTIDGEKIYEDKRLIPELSPTKIFEPLKFRVSSDTKLDEFTLCVYLKSSSEVYDTYCFDVRKQDFEYVKDVKYSVQNVKYYENESLLEVKLCAFNDIFDEPVQTTAMVQLYLSNGSKIGGIEKSVNGCATLSFSNVDAKNECDLVVYDKIFKKQYVFKLIPEKYSSKDVESLEKIKEKESSNKSGVTKIIIVLSCVSVILILILSRR